MNIRLTLVVLFFTGCSMTHIPLDVSESHPASPKALEARVTYFSIGDDFRENSALKSSTQMKKHNHTQTMQMNHEMTKESDSEHGGNHQ